MSRYNLKSIHFTQIDDIFMLQKAKLIGRVLKPMLLAGTVLVFSGDSGTGGAAVKLYGHAVHARLLCPTTIPDDELTEIIRGASHTLFKAREIQINTDPMYTAEEICGL